MRRAAVLLLLLLLLPALFGCAGDDDDRSAGAPAAEGESADEDSGGDGGGAGGGSVVVASAAQLPDAERSVIRTASLRVATGDVEDTAADALGIVEAAGGFLSSASSDLVGDQSATLVYRVPPPELLATLEALAGLGELEQREIGSQDVTEQVVDLEGRLAAVRASVERLRGLIADAADVPQIVAVESELAAREGELESLTGQLRSLRGQVDLATVTLQLREPGDVEVSDDIPGFGDGLETGLVAFVNIGKGALAVLGFLLPFALALAVVGVPVVWFVRRRRRRMPAATG
jgi:hypothetical protein